MRKSAGFTLLEMIVSISIMSLITLGVAAIFVMFFETDTSLGRQERMAREIQNIHTLHQHSPSTLNDSLLNFYGDAYDLDSQTVYFSSAFVPDNEGERMIIINQTIEDNADYRLYTITLTMDDDISLSPLITNRTIKEAVE